MLRVLRTLLIWLLAFALPAQGVMAATMVLCGPNHHGRASAVAVAHGADAADRLQDAAAHAHPAAADGHAEAEAVDDAAAPDRFAQSDLHKCSVCASCCSAAAIHDTVPKLPILEPVSAPFSALVSAVEPFAAAGPDRPPRHLLA